ncbi:MAG: PqqD family protein [Myxococcales bacterium]|nr:PqqD family protein [Myxococcales bacterium]
MAISSEQRVAITPEVLSRTLDGEAILLDLASGTYFGLDGVGTLLWELFEQGTTVGEATARIVAVYDVDATTARSDLEELLSELTRRGLVRVS